MATGPEEVLAIHMPPRPDVADEKARFGKIFFNVAPAMFLGILDQTIVATALPAMAAALGNFAHIAWVVTAYLLAATIAAPVYGRLGDAFGRKRAMIWALSLFVAGSIVCTLAPTFELLLGGRVLQGLGGGGLMTLAQALIGEAVSPRDRGRFQGWLSANFALASTIGPLAGGFLSEHLGWRAIFWANIPLGLATALAMSRVKALPGDRNFRFDLPGTALTFAASLALPLSLTFGVAIGWDNVLVPSMFGLALLGFVLLIQVERRAKDPLIPVDLLAVPAVWRCALCVFLFSGVLFAMVVQLPLFLQLVLSVGPTFAGLMLLPAILSQVLMALLTGTYISRTGRTGKTMALGFAISTIGLFTLAGVLHLGLWPIAGASMLAGLGLGTIGPTSQTVVQWAGGQAELGRATGLVSLSRSIGGLIGTALASTLLIGAFHYLAPELTSQIGAALSAAVQNVSLPAASAHTAEIAFRTVFMALGVVTAFGGLLAATIPSIDLGKPRV